MFFKPSGGFGDAGAGAALFRLVAFVMTAGRRHAKASAAMPNLDEALEAVGAASGQHDGGGSGAPRFDDLRPLERAIAYVIFRTLGSRRCEAALAALREADLLDARRLAAADLPEIVDALRSKRIDASVASLAPLRHLAQWAVDQDEAGNLAADEPGGGATACSVDSLRESLRDVKGIGPAAADGIVLFALDRPSYPLDRATYRVFVRHGWLDPGASYDEARDLVVERARGARPDDQDATRLLQDVSRAMDDVGRQFCRAAAPRCQGCPLEPFLPEGGPYEHDG